MSLLSNPSRAEYTSLIDDFNDGDLVEYTDVSSGDGYVKLITSPTYEGSHAIEAGADADRARLASMPGDGLSYYPDPGDSWTYHVQHTSTGDAFARFHFGVQAATSDTDDSYVIEIGSSGLRIRKWSAGSFNNLASASASYSTGVWYTIQVDWATDGTITATFEEDDGTQIATTSATDTDYTDGGVAWGQATGSAGAQPVYMDYARTV